jgi:hypothetical protein
VSPVSVASRRVSLIIDFNGYPSCARTGLEKDLRDFSAHSKQKPLRSERQLARPRGIGFQVAWMILPASSHWARNARASSSVGNFFIRPFS